MRAFAFLTLLSLARTTLRPENPSSIEGRLHLSGDDMTIPNSDDAQVDLPPMLRVPPMLRDERMVELQKKAVRGNTNAKSKVEYYQVESVITTRQSSDGDDAAGEAPPATTNEKAPMKPKEFSMTGNARVSRHGQEKDSSNSNTNTKSEGKGKVKHYKGEGRVTIRTQGAEIEPLAVTKEQAPIKPKEFTSTGHGSSGVGRIMPFLKYLPKASFVCEDKSTECPAWQDNMNGDCKGMCMDNA